MIGFYRLAVSPISEVPPVLLDSSSLATKALDPSGKKTREPGPEYEHGFGHFETKVIQVALTLLSGRGAGLERSRSEGGDQRSKPIFKKRPRAVSSGARGSGLERTRVPVAIHIHIHINMFLHV